MNESRELTARKSRVKWIDCAKAIAIIAVVVDHCKGTLYSNPYIQESSYFSVSLFVLLSGMTTYIANSKCGGVNWHTQLKQLGKIMLQYALAVFVVLSVTAHFFDFKTYLQYIVSFDIYRPYYFLLFYIQLLLISPILIHWCKFCDFRKYKYAWHIITLLVLIWLSSIFIRYTCILPVYGGGKYLAGGTYIVLYYLGILFIKLDLFNKCIQKRRMFILMGSLLLCVIWVYGRMHSLFKVDEKLSPWFGGGINPPGFELIIFSLLVLFALYCFFSLLEEKIQWSDMIIKLFSQIGKNTLHIFMYHLLILRTILAYAPTFLLNNIWIRRVIIFFPTLILPTIIATFASKVIARFRTFDRGCS